MKPIPESTLRATYAREQPQRRGWPADYAEGMADPIIARIVDMLARRQVPAFGRARADRARIGLDAPPPPPAPEPAPAPDPSHRPRWRPLAPGQLDRKRAASGEREDTDE